MTERDPKSNEIITELKEHFNEPILIFTEVYRLVGYAEDKHDCYIITKKHNGTIEWNSCVGGCIYLDRLKGQQYVRGITGEDWDDFFRLDKWLEYNGCPKEKEFLIDLRPEQDWEWETDDNV